MPTHEVPPDLNGERADRVVAVLADVSRSVARRVIDEGRVKVADANVSPSLRLDAGCRIEIPDLDLAPRLLPEPVEFGVVYADEAVIVVDKPAGLVVHPGAGRSSGTLAAGLLHRFPEIEGVGAPGRWGIVHRLDRGTSGLLVVARSHVAYQELSAQIRARTVTRRYLAVAHGRLDFIRGTIDAPIGRDPNVPTRFRAVPDGRPAVTHYRVLDRSTDPAATLLVVTLETGRTHQIRVHLAAIDHPLLGDRTYSRLPDPVALPRVFLHATELGFDHPATGEREVFRSPLPAGLSETLPALDLEMPADLSGEEPGGFEGP